MLNNCKSASDHPQATIPDRRGPRTETGIKKLSSPTGQRELGFVNESGCQTAGWPVKYSGSLPAFHLMLQPILGF
jgi:hypothetical protein